MERGGPNAEKARRKRTRISGEERQRESYRLWFDEKKPLREVAEILGCSHETVRGDIQKVLDHIVDEFDEEIRSLRSKQLRRLLSKHDRIEKIANDEAVSISDRIKAENAGLGVLKEINEVLGVKAALKHEHSAPGGAPLAVIVEVVNGTKRTSTDQDTDQ